MRSHVRERAPRRWLTAIAVGIGLLAASAVSNAPAQAAGSAVVAQVPSSCSPAVSLVNGGFEDPVITPGVAFSNTVPGWSTTASDGMIELWRSTTPSAATGTQHAELNANQVSTLFQDVTTVPGQTLKWQLQHRGRAGTDVMAVLLGPPSGPLLQQGAAISDGNGAWGTHSGLYVVPAGQTMTRFAFQSVSSAGGNPGLGNFLDSISLGNAACVIATKSVTNTSRAGTDAVAGDVLEYSVEVENHGGVPATSVVVTDAIPAGATFVPGSIVGPASILSDFVGDDVGEFNAGNVVVRIGDGASNVSGGSLAAGASLTVRFQVVVDGSAVGIGVDNEASVSFVESLSGAASVSVSNTTSTPVLPSADLQVTQSLDTTPLTNGDPIQYTITVTNNGPQTSTDTELTSTLPLLGMSVAEPGCTITLADLVCDFGSMLNTAVRTVVVTGTVPAGEAGGTVYLLQSSVAGSVHDPDSTNNTDTTFASVAEDGALTVDMTITNTTFGSAGRPAREGELLRASYLVTNTGNVDLSSLALTDPVFGSVTCAPTTLTPAATATCSADVLYPVTALDVQNGAVSSTVTAQANWGVLGGSVASGAAAASMAAAAAPAAVAAAIALTGSSPQAGLLLAGILLALGMGAVGVARRRVDPA
jgi:uncharacterized repeat protein (TIGR01451 family)